MHRNLVLAPIQRQAAYWSINYTATQTQVVPKVTCLLTELTEEAVTKHLLEFFEKLASEPSDAGSLPIAKRARRD